MTAAALLERFEAGDSVLHRADARVKLCATLGYILAVALTLEGDWLTLALLLPPLVLGIALSGLSPLFVVRRGFLALPFVLVALPVLFNREGTPLFEVPFFGWVATEEGLEAVATIFARSWISVLAAVLLTATTPANELLRGLRSLRVPRILVATVAFAYRYLFVIAEEASRLMRARDSRSAALPGRRAGGSLGWRARVLGSMVGSLFVRSLDRSERVYAAMQSRGYAGEFRFLDTPTLRGIEVAAAVALTAYVALVQLRAHLA